jgi:hypothetical protein
MTQPARRLANFLRRPLRDQWLFIQAYLCLGLARLIIAYVPFPRLARHLGQQLKESPIDVPTAHLLEARRVAWAVQRASCFTPWKSNCFPQAITAKYLLHRQGIASTLYLGAAFKMRSELTAHAWLRCGPLYVTGGAGRHHVETLGIFS